MKTPPNNNSLPFQLDRVAFYGPTLTENLKMFDIDDISLKEYKILDCPSGSSSFVAEAKNRYGIHAIRCDPLFGKDLETSVERGRQILDLLRN